MIIVYHERKLYSELLFSSIIFCLFTIFYWKINENRDFFFILYHWVNFSTCFIFISCITLYLSYTISVDLVSSMLLRLIENLLPEVELILCNAIWFKSVLFLLYEYFLQQVYFHPFYENSFQRSWLCNIDAISFCLNLTLR